MSVPTCIRIRLFIRVRGVRIKIERRQLDPLISRLVKWFGPLNSMFSAWLITELRVVPRRCASSVRNRRNCVLVMVLLISVWLNVGAFGCGEHPKSKVALKFIRLISCRAVVRLRLALFGKFMTKLEASRTLGCVVWTCLTRCRHRLVARPWPTVPRTWLDFDRIGRRRQGTSRGTLWRVLTRLVVTLPGRSAAQWTWLRLLTLVSVWTRALKFLFFLLR